MEESSQRKLDLVVKTGLRLTSSADLQTIVQAATDAGVELCDAQFGAFFYNVADEEGKRYLLYTLSGVEREKFSAFPMPRNTAIFGPTFDGTAIVRSADITKDPRYGHNAPHFGMPKGHLPVRSYLAVPVKARNGEVLGGLFYGHEQAGKFDEHCEDLIATIAAQAAIAIENARLQEQLNKGMDDLNRAEENRRQSAKHLSELAAIVESSDDAIISKDLTGTITSWNRAATRILGYTSDEMIGQSILKLIPRELHPDEAVILRKIRSGERIDHFETIRLTKSGKLLNVSLTISPIKDASGQIIGASKILRDISARKLVETSLLQAEKIAATGRMAATIAHEINNPLEAVMNLIYLSRSMATDTEQTKLLVTAENEITRVSHIAKQTLGYYRENASAISTSVSRLMAETLNIYSPRCARYGISLQTSLDSSREIILRRGEIMQVISNLIANSIQAMPSGGILSIAVYDIKEGVSIIVKDTGVGIPQDVLPYVFDAFFTTQKDIGTGIGLFIAKKFVEGHNGSIHIESSTAPESHGTTVRIFMPSENKAALS